MNRLEIVILSYNRLASLRLQLERLRELGYSDHPDIKIIIHDNFSTDETVAYLSCFNEYEITSRCWDRNLGYGNSYLRAHEFCESAFLWIVGDDYPIIPANDFLSLIDSTPKNVLYSVFRGNQSSLPVIPSKLFSKNGILDIEAKNILDIDSNIIELLAGFVSGAVWRAELSKNIFRNYKSLFLNNFLTCNSPQFFFLPLMVLDSGLDENSTVQVRVHFRSITSQKYGLIDERKKLYQQNYVRILITSLLKYSLHPISSVRYVFFNNGLLVPAGIWVHASYVAGNLLGSTRAVENISKYHLYPMAFHFSIFYNFRNLIPALVLTSTAIRAVLSLKFGYDNFNRIHICILIYRIVRCQLVGIRLKSLFY
jgi:glycosyltransferase involved in cell wall biosynthesis